MGNELPLADFHPRTVAFVCKKDHLGEVTPRGTCFLVGVRVREGGTAWPFFVTAKHLVKGTEEVLVRLRRHDGGPAEDVPVGPWEPHPSADIAAAPCDFDISPFVIEKIPEGLFADAWQSDSRIVPGDFAHFIGLLSNVESMAAGIPMNRSGRIGALDQSAIPFEDDRGRIEYEPRAHLIDATSYFGFSGSPCFVEKLVPDLSDGLRIGSVIIFLGVVVGHFPHYVGVVVVVPADVVKGLLQREALVANRNEKEEKQQQQRERPRASRSGTEEEDREFDRFEKLTRTLVNTPKPEKDDGKSQ